MPPAESPFTLPNQNNRRPTNHAGGSPFTANARGSGRTNSALDEHSFLNNTHNALDSYIAQGQAILGNLHGQRDMMKGKATRSHSSIPKLVTKILTCESVSGTQKRLLSVANTLGLSRETITFIERRGKGDSYVLFGGIAITLLAFYLILRYFG